MKTKQLLYLILLMGLNLNAQINVSTGVDVSGNALPNGSADPFWYSVNGPLNGSSPIVSPSPGLSFGWENTPVSGTNAGMINSFGNCCDNAQGIYTFERSFNIVSGTPVLACNFSVAYQDFLFLFELVKPDLTTIPLTVISGSESLLSNAVTDVFPNPMPGTWKIRAKVFFLDNSAFFLLSGYINEHCRTLYVDADADGFDDGTVIDCSGTVPTGFSLTSLGVDCDDSNAAVNPNHVEVPGNGIDDNCNGTIDEVTPPVRIIPSQCGTTLTSLWNTIFATQSTIPGTTSYRFEISSGSYVQTYDTSTAPLYQCNMYNFPGVSYGTSYTIRVAVKVGGFWQAYGPSCTITTPAGLVTSLVPSSCGITVSSSWNSLFINPATSVSSNVVTRYRVQVQVGSTSYYLLMPPSPTMFNLRNSAFSPLVPLIPNTTYRISVQVQLNGVWQTSGGQDLYGPTCVVTSSPTYSRQSGLASDETDFKAIAYPNPYTDSFNLDVGGVNENAFEIKIYDMMGRLTETREVHLSDFRTIEFGKHYASGVYNVIVTQGENVKTLRVIKR